MIIMQQLSSRATRDPAPSLRRKHRNSLLRLAAGLATLLAATASQAGGYFILGYGPYANQSAGTSTAIGMDGFAGASNPAKLTEADDRLDLGLIVFAPYRRIERTDAQVPAYNFASTSENDWFFLPEVGYVQHLNERWSVGLSIYGNGGLNTEYRDTTGIPGTNNNPGRCGNQPGNFFFGCGKLGFDLSQLIVAPTLAWKINEKHSIGGAPLLAYQRLKMYGLQAFESLSQTPNAVSNNGNDDTYGAGLRVGWFGNITPWLDMGLSYATRVYMDEFDKYRGLLADEGDFDIPENYSLGLAIKPSARWTIGLDIQRIRFGEIRALSNGVLNSIEDPAGKPLGSKNGSGFNWRSTTRFKTAVAYEHTPALTLRAGFSYGERAQRDDSADSVSFNLLAPNPIYQVSAGFGWRIGEHHEFNASYSRYLKGTYSGPSASAALGIGGTERITPNVDQFMFAYSRRF
ncbi:MAG: long-chain fatty acid transporter [Salinisphaeraceae bacterium]|nr:long-chain fatty acid transporter [Salinisphaeraceae bacterium]